MNSGRSASSDTVVFNIIVCVQYINIFKYIDVLQRLWLVVKERHGKTENTLRRLSDEGLCSVAELGRTRKYAVKLRSGKSAAVISDVAGKLAALGDPNRLMLVMLIRRKEMCVCEVTQAVSLTQPMASYQLGLLERTGIVRRRKIGKWAFFSIDDIQFVDAVLKKVKVPGAGKDV